MNKFDVDFVIRTKEILEDYAGKRDLSNLLNCTLGLIILPYENVKSSTESFWDLEIEKIPDMPSCQIHNLSRLVAQKKVLLKSTDQKH